MHSRKTDGSLQPGLTENVALTRSDVALLGCLLFVTFLITGFSDSRLDIPKPTDPLAPPPPAPPVERSVVNLKVSLALNDLAAAADAAVPREEAQAETWQDGGTIVGHGPYQYRYVFSRGPVHVRMAEDHLAIEIPEIQYRFAVRVTMPGGKVVEDGCALGTDPPNRVRLSATARLSWSDTWTLKTETAFEPSDFLDACRLVALDVDGTPIVQSLLESRLRAMASAIDAKLRERTETKKRAETVWRKLQEATEIAPNLWLALNPTSAQVGPIGSDGDRLIQTSVNLLLNPLAIVGSRLDANERPLSTLHLSPALLEGFHLAVPIQVPYPEVNRRLAEQLVGREIDIPHSDPLTITSAQLYGSGNNLIVELGIKGPINGILYVAGKPVIDPATRVLRFDELDFTIDTKNVLLKSANWVLHKSLLSRIEPETHIDLSEHIDALRKRLARAFTRELAPGTWLNGTVTRLDPYGLYPVPDGVEVQIIADGFLQLSVQ